MYVRHPIWIRRVQAPGAEAFAILFALESFARSLLTTVIPLEALKLLGTAQEVSLLFLLASIIGLVGSFAVPFLVRASARRWVYTGAAVLLAAAPLVLWTGTLGGQAIGMALRAFAVVALTICANLYIMDHINRRDFARAEPIRIFYSAGAWCAGPALGIYLQREFGDGAPYLVSSVCVLIQLAYFWYLRMSEGTVIGPAIKPVPNPFANLLSYFRQPRLAMAWLTMVGKNSWWATFFTYAPIYTVKSGLGELVGGLLVSLGTGFLFLMPIWGAAMRRFGLRRLFIAGFLLSGLATLGAGAFAGLPWLGAGLLALAAFFLVSLDAAGNILFMRAVKPRERAEMTTVYSTFRDAAELTPPAVFSVVLKVFPLPAVFFGAGAALLGLAVVCRKIHPRL